MKNMKKIIVIISFVILSFFVISHSSQIQASYVLPYPSFMPGNKLYKISRIVDQLNNWWYFGNIAQIKYHLGLSDKYLVEAKTLFEYKQYLLGVDALKRSTKQFQTLPLFVKQGISENKNMNSLISTISEAVVIHRSILQEMKISCPETFQWIPEKKSATDLKLHNELDAADSVVVSVVKEIER